MKVIGSRKAWHLRVKCKCDHDLELEASDLRVGRFDAVFYSGNNGTLKVCTTCVVCGATIRIDDKDMWPSIRKPLYADARERNV